MTFLELDELVKTTADGISRIVNAGDKTDIAKLATLMLKDHRTLIQAKMGLCLKFIEGLDAQYQDGYYDLRSEHACKIAKRICETVDPHERQMPLI